MIGLYRDCVYMIKQDAIGIQVLGHVSDLYIATQKQSQVVYEALCDDLESVDPLKIEQQDSSMLLSVRSQLDKKAHSKQLGRDIVECYRYCLWQ